MSAILMLRHLGADAHADAIEKALLRAFRDGVKTPDIGGTVGTKAFTRGVIERLG